ncbi:hypothetical protein HPP92_018494 [Vanilla planifolia]|nr:hypothetical protein HPP92_018494 [Vanilla planifolia]
MFTSEEPTRFGISCLGSRLLAGSQELAHALHEVVDEQNISFVEAARTAGYASQEDLSSVFLKKQNYFSFIELHIEQGPILEQEGIPIGVVTAIAAPASIQVEFEGNGGHAGAVLMSARNDAGLAAAELSLAVEKHVLDSGSIDTVGTVGVMNLHPGAINSIPSKAHIEIDARDIDEERRNVVVNKIYQSAVQIAEKRGVRLSKFKIVNQDPPALSSSMIIKTMEDAAKQLNFDSMRMISRAYHDSLFMARISPMGMIFIPCYRGYSHKPEEFASPENIAKGVKRGSGDFQTAFMAGTKRASSTVGNVGGGGRGRSKQAEQTHEGPREDEETDGRPSRNSPPHFRSPQPPSPPRSVSSRAAIFSSFHPKP